MAQRSPRYTSGGKCSRLTRMHLQIIYVSLLSLLLSSCKFHACPLPDDYKDNSQLLATMEEVQGMTNYYVDLRIDKKYICYYDSPERATSFGTFTINNDTLLLKPICDRRSLLCHTYYINTNSNIPGYLLAQPICTAACDGHLHEELWFTWRQD